ncbi:adenosylmethionine--8-amino-7-oxononanoate transaminase [Psychrilyobacter piezotolerans]|uniref:Adenosylmethionine-8-amino-7-oxononanoate aminotransferase n=1 Tax=Psychrilyobacter piezotolerans TaxID=2293438 RepID=A0ABX9KJG5_9FUSO|nr:adenosylmethionine--8-amino-7-oxononanoate transaminase [Psychrilyobacter piezotolerans]RDE64660.1 adenosylmethionine--8-amino-7-oxononanoate transaminase [Psychrilyobacter sp. S5]REI42472.1 adenosylmethionine--8-amino-7-oxononanoate transaminase [Psychrilyobacter piezotolerans]
MEVSKLENIWFPYTQMKTMTTPIQIEKGEGVYLYTNDGDKLIDTVSSWWCAIHGYNNIEINNAIKDQIDKMSHIMLGGLVHQPVMELSKKLSAILPGDLNHCFFSDSGSVGVEVALKMAVQYFNNSGEKRTKFISFIDSYHGDTWKAMEVGDDPDYHKAFKGDDIPANFYVEPDNIDELEDILKKHSAEIAGFIVEPILQGAGGFKIHSREYLKNARKLCDRYGVLFIFDEVATGFGRTGDLFVASEDLIPDIIVLGKALTGGYLGHAVTVATDEIYDKFYSDSPEDAFMHGPTFMGNPLACAAGLKSIEIFQREDYLSKIKKIESTLMKLKEIDHPLIKEVRVIGGCGCIEVTDNKILKGFKEYCFSKGIWNRTFLNFAYIMPPYIISSDELNYVVETFKTWFEQEQKDVL